MKKMIAIILIATLAATAVITQLGGLFTAQAGWEAHIGYPGPDTYSYCYHTHWPYADDRCVGIGIDARYDTSHGDNPPYAYYKTYWNHFSSVGYGGSRYWYFYPYDYDNTQIYDCWWKQNGIWSAYSYDGDADPYWDGGVFKIVERYPDTGFYYLSPCATTICGQISQLFYQPHYPYPIVTYLSVQVQPFDRVTACQDPNQPYYG